GSLAVARGHRVRPDSTVRSVAQERRRPGLLARFRPRHPAGGLAAGLRVLGLPFRDAATDDAGYCRDVSTVDGYWLANMELLAERPRLDLHDPAWPIWTPLSQLPPARFSGRGVARESIVCAGCEIFGEVRHPVLSVGCEVGAHTVIEDSVILTNVRIGRGCRIRRAIVDAECAPPD